MSADVRFDLFHLVLKGLCDRSVILACPFLLLKHCCNCFFESQHDSIVENGVLKFLMLFTLCTRQSLYGTLSLYNFSLFRLLLKIELLFSLFLILIQFVLCSIEMDPTEPLGVLQMF